VCTTIGKKSFAYQGALVYITNWMHLRAIKFLFEDLRRLDLNLDLNF
jgi:hypothetical protein